MIKSLDEFVYGKSIYLYGTGVFSKWMSDYLVRNKVKISGYIISSKPEKSVFMGYPLFCIEDVVLTEDDAIVMSVVKWEFTEEIKALLRKHASKINVYFPSEHEDLKRLLIKHFKRERKLLSERRKRINIFNYQEIAQPFVFKRPVCFRDVEEYYGYYWCINYGIDRCLKKYLKSCNLDEFGSSIIHGVRFYPRFAHRELNPPNKNIFCMADTCFDKNIACINNIYAIGPYIKWVKPLFSKKKIAEIKKKLGKTLMVVPSHVTMNKEDGNIPFDAQSLIEEIERVRITYKFQTVLISIGPFTDVKEATNIYGKMNYKLISSGPQIDLFFLSRQRTFIELADVAMGNDVWSTFPGYSIALNKPYYHFQQKIGYEDCEHHNAWLGFDKQDDAKGNSVEQEFLYCFGTYREKITDVQRDYVKKFWGVKSNLRK